MSRPKGWAVLLAACVGAGCGVTGTAVGNSRKPTRAYETALEEGKLDQAYDLTSDAYRRTTTRNAFRERWTLEAARRQHAQEIGQAVQALERVAPELAAAPTEGATFGEDQAREVVKTFVTAIQGGDFAAAYGLLAPALRTRYSPDQLRSDYQSEPAAKARLERALLALRLPPLEEGTRLRFPVGAGRAVELVLEGPLWRLAALE